MADAGRVKREPGAPSPLAARRGGPANFDGVGYQVQFGVYRMLDWLLMHRGDPSAAGVARCEPRLLHTPEEHSEEPAGGSEVRQYGFDLGLTGCPSSDGDEYFEVKLSPVHDEALDLLASLQHLPEDGRPLRVAMVTAKETAPFRTLAALYGYAQEAATDAELRALVEAVDKNKLTEMLDAVGPSPLSALERLAEPMWVAETVVREKGRWLATTLAGGPDGGEELLNRLTQLVTDGSKHRRSIVMAKLLGDLSQDGLVQPPSAAAVPENGDLAAVMVVLEACPVPLPKKLLAEAMGRSFEQLEEELAEPVAVGIVHEAGDSYYRVSASTVPLATSFGQNLIGEVLAVLSNWGAEVKARASTQTLNAHALARLCIESHPEVVADTFKSFDKASKVWGDLSITWDLAQCSNAALLRLLDGHVSHDDKRKWAATRAQTYICGQGWVMQRVDELDQAMYYMKLAKDISEQYHDDENHAYTLKCEGRLLRMKAEGIPDGDPRRPELLARSTELLTDAYSAFDELLKSNARFVEDRGECVSLLARTLATVPNIEHGVRETKRANALLVSVPESKAYADLKILEAELFLHTGGTDENARAREREGHHETLTTLVEQHTVDPRDGFDRGASEIVARLHRTLGWLDEEVDPPGAVASYREAAAQYERLDYRPGREDALWRSRMVAGEPIPPPLLAAMDAADAAPGARLLALDKHLNMSTGGAAAARIGGSPQDESPVGDHHWTGIVSESVAEHTAATPRWADGRTA